jgi:mono/diheme cytochrome c family protein
MEFVKHHILITISFVSIALLIACASPTPTPFPTDTPTPEPVAVTPEHGAQLARQMGCAACHSADGNPSVGPTWKGLFGKTENLTDGSTVVADEAYLRESILTPNARVVEGFLPGVMPQNFREQLTDAEVQAVIDYIKTLQ